MDMSADHCGAVSGSRQPIVNTNHTIGRPTIPRTADRYPPKGCHRPEPATWRSEPVANLSEKQLQFLENPFAGVVTTLRPDGSPPSTIVWVDAADGEVSFNTALGRVKPTNLEHDP